MFCALPVRERVAVRRDHLQNSAKRGLTLAEAWDGLGVKGFDICPEVYSGMYDDQIENETPATIRTRALRLIASREGRG